MAKLSPHHYDTFKKGSKTYFNASRFFPKHIRDDVFILYGFVRKADDLVDAIPQDKEGFYSFREKYRGALQGVPADDIFIDQFVELAKEKYFDPKWAEAFLYSMELDLIKSEYNSQEECLEYIYGSAEVIGFYMCKILDLPLEAYEPAGMLGRAMQYINFIRDIHEDQGLGRRYLPLKGTSLVSLEPSVVNQKPAEFKAFLRAQAEIYLLWQKQAQNGFKYLPKKLLAPIKTASDMYNWTARKIMEDPLIVFKKKVKPSKMRILFCYFLNIFYRPEKSSQ